LLKQAADKQMKGKFEVTMEATHHGPHVDIPACFLEIGSTENEWSVPELGQFWAQLLSDHFREETTEAEGGGVVVMSIGGGHYVPKLNDAARFGDGLYTGHALATYTLQEHLDGTAALPLEGGWKGVVHEAVHSTRIAHPTAQLICLVDKKAFGAEKRKAVTSYLEELGVVWTNQLSDVRKLYDETLVATASSSIAT
jgi:D-aminoacyl-tRNA deacylase